MLDFFTALWLGVVGACIGSFVNVVAYRMPRGMSVAWKPSHCPKCGHDIRWYDNVPVLGWVSLRGRCRDCGEPISPRYAIVEAVMGAAFVVLAYVELFSGGANLPGGPFVEDSGAWNTVWNPSWIAIRLFAYHALLLSILMPIVLMAQDKQRIPRRLIQFALVVIALAAWNWRHLYVDRRGMLRSPQWTALADALFGILWGASPSIIALGVAHFRRRPDHVEVFRTMAMAAAIVGGFLGLRSIVRITIMWLIMAAIVRVFPMRDGQRITSLAPLWLATLLHILLWKQLAGVLSW